MRSALQPKLQLIFWLLITEVDATQITFVVPSGLTAGENPIVLKRAGIEQILGSVSIAEAEIETAPLQLYGIGWKSDNPGDGTQSELYQIDPATGAITHLTTFPDGLDWDQSLAIGHTIYAIGAPISGLSTRSIVGYNLDTKEPQKLSERISDKNYYDVLGTIDDKLHVLSCVNNMITLFSIDATTGAKPEVAKFGEIQDLPYFDGFLFGSGNFAYDAQSKKITIGGYWDGDRAAPHKEEYVKTVVLDLSSNSMTCFAVEEDIFEHTCFMRNTQVCRMYEYWRESDDATFMVIETLDSQCKNGTQIASISEVNSIIYDAVRGVAYGYSKAGFFSSDFKTTPATLKIIAAGSVAKIRELVVVR